MSIVHMITFTPPITHPERFASWSQDVQKLLDYLPHYVAAGRKQRIFALSWDAWDALPSRDGSPRGSITPNMFFTYYEQHHLEPLIVPNHQQACDQFIQQLPVNAQVETQQHHTYEQIIHSLYGNGPHVYVVLNLPGKGLSYLLGMEQGGMNSIPIRGPDGIGKPIVTETEVAFNIDITTYDHGHAFYLSLEDLLQENSVFWKLVGEPHDILVKAALIRLVYYFPEIEVSSDREAIEWWEPSLLCQKLFGVADVPPGIWGDSDRPNEEARRQLLSLANSLPDSLG